MSPKKPYPIVFFGTPEFSVPTLKALNQNPNFKIKLVVSQPDRPAGRNLKLTSSPVKVCAQSLGLPVLTPESCKSEDFISMFKDLKVTGAIVIAFGQILNQKLLNLCPNKFINIHASLLPHLRGAAPIQRSLMLGNNETGVCAQVMVKKLDAGDVISKRMTPIKIDENSLELHDRLSILSCQMLDEISLFFDGEVKPQPQDETLVSYAAKIEKNETWIDWSKSSIEVWNHIRGLALGPGGATLNNSKRLKIIKAHPLLRGNGVPGQVLDFNPDGFIVACGHETALMVTLVQPESKPQMLASAYIHGGAIHLNDILGNRSE